MPRRKVLKVVVDLTFNAVTCPGVVLPDQANVFLNVDVFGECKKSECLPAVFPFLFHEKMRFEKTFHRATDPVQVASALAADLVRIELVQLSYPAGELLACYQENSREFLFPTPRVSPTYPGVDREVLLNRTDTFPGIAPKLEFSSRTIIKEVNARGSSCLLSKAKKEKQPTKTIATNCTTTTNHKKKPASSGTGEIPTTHAKSLESAAKERRCDGATKSRKSRSSHRVSSSKSRKPQITVVNKDCSSPTRRYRQSTISSRARSPSPYTRRRMAQLSVNDPFESAVAARPFRTELEERPEFVVRKSNNSSPTLQEKRRSPAKPRSPGRNRSPTIPTSYESSEQSFTCNKRPVSAPGSIKEDLFSTPIKTDVYGSPQSETKSILIRTPLRERYYSNESSPYLEIRDRVRGLLTPSYNDYSAGIP